MPLPRNSITKAKRRGRMVSRVPATPTRNRMEKLHLAMEKAVTADLVNGYTRFRLRVSKVDLDKAFRDGGYKGVIKAIPYDKLPEDMRAAAKNIVKTRELAVKESIRGFRRAESRKYRPDDKNPLLRPYTQARQEKYLTKLASEDKKVIARVTDAAIRTGATPAQLAETILPRIGLNERQGVALGNYEKGLKKTDLTDKQVKSLVKEKSEAMLERRALTIAITESRNAGANAQLATWLQMEADGLLGEDPVRIWNIADEQACPELCQPMDGKQIPLDGEWTLPNGKSIKVVTESHPNCRCIETLDYA